MEKFGPLCVPAHHRLLQRVAQAGALWFLLVLVIVQLNQLDQPVTATVTSYFVGPYGGWLHFAFFVMAGSIAVFAGTVHGVVGSRSSLLCAVLLMLCALATTFSVWVGSLPLPGDPSPATRAEWHYAGAVAAFVSGLLAMVVCTGMVWRRREFLGVRRPLALLVLAMFLTLAAVPAFPLARGFLEKLAIGEMVLWQLLMIRRLLACPLPAAGRATVDSTASAFQADDS